MLSQKLTKALREIPREVHRLAAGGYPAFVTAADPGPLADEIPVFMFHTVAPASFERQLAFLRRNGYHTPTLEEFMRHHRGEIRLPSPAALLTFDDGEKSLYRVAYPLLKAYDLRAVAFVVPHYLQEWPEECDGKCWLSWPEVVEMQQSGVIDIQSHTYYHDRVFTHPTLVDFYHPGYAVNQLAMDVPWIGDGDEYGNHLRWGTPIYRSASRLGSRPRYLDDPSVRTACTSWVEGCRDAKFFQDPSWRRQLGRAYRRYARDPGGRFESVEEQRTRMLADLVRPRKALEARLGKPVRHLSYPWGEGSYLSVALSREAGYVADFWTAAPSWLAQPNHDRPWHFSRIKDDYLLRLPGQGRVPLADILMAKLKRRSQTVDIY